MNAIQSQFVKGLLRGVPVRPRDEAEAFAPANIALCKYWGKRDEALNLPRTDSLSVSLGELGTRTRLRRTGKSGPDRVVLNGRAVDPESRFHRRIRAFLDLFRPFLGDAAEALEVETFNTVPTAAGLASSASGFAALTLALDELGGWGLDRRRLSMLARLGSGSATRSLLPGFVLWQAGRREDGTDSFAVPLPERWPGLRIGILEICGEPKAVGSREGMRRTVRTSRLYESWPRQVEEDLDEILRAIAERDFPRLGRAAERNALAMHATMLAAWPPLLYFRPETLAALDRLHRARAEGAEIYATLDAGPNIKLLFTAEDEAEARRLFPEMTAVVAPFEAEADQA